MKSETDTLKAAPCRCGEIGKHARLKIAWLYGLVGSSPTSGTIVVHSQGGGHHVL